ncbi:hypothetical protein RJ55_07892 [Drechmeria coniospora]|nr:hypothetical protein RJ55_07892 [Drechmeria coniospora]
MRQRFTLNRSDIDGSSRPSSATLPRTHDDAHTAFHKLVYRRTFPRGAVPSRQEEKPSTAKLLSLPDEKIVRCTCRCLRWPVLTKLQEM